MSRRKRRCARRDLRHRHGPHSLFRRLMLIWLVGLAVVLGVSAWLYQGERGRVARDAHFDQVALDVATVVALMDRVPPAERAHVLDGLQRMQYRFALGTLPEGRALADDLDHPAWRRLRDAMGGRALELRAAYSGEQHRPYLYLGTRLADGSPFYVETTPPLPAPPPARILAALAALLVGVAMVTLIAVRMATRPLTRLAEAAQELGEDLDRPPLAEEGPREVRDAAAAFNAMQERLRAHFAERTRILAAVSHDLQTPITRMRLRAELMDDETLRERMLDDLAAMQALVEEGLAYAGGLAAPREDVLMTDIDALLAALVADYADGGRMVALGGTCGQPVATRPRTLRRLLGNLVDNALKFGDEVEIAVDTGPDRLDIAVRDRGPGIPEVELDKVFEPFYRVEASRNRDTGGTGLGLAIARQLADVLDAELTLHNREGGGLEARLALI